MTLTISEMKEKIATLSKHEKAVDAILENAANGCIAAIEKIAQAQKETLRQLNIIKGKQVIGSCDTFQEFHGKSGLTYEDAKELWETYWEIYEEKENIATGN